MFFSLLSDQLLTGGCPLSSVEDGSKNWILYDGLFRTAREGTYSTYEGDILLTERELSSAVLQIKGSGDGTKRSNRR